MRATPEQVAYRMNEILAYEGHPVTEEALGRIVVNEHDEGWLTFFEPPQVLRATVVRWYFTPDGRLTRPFSEPHPFDWTTTRSDEEVDAMLERFGSPAIAGETA